MTFIKNYKKVFIIIIIALILAIGGLYKIIRVNKAEYLAPKEIELIVKVSSREEFGVNVIREKDILKEYDTGALVGAIRAVEVSPASRNATTSDGQIKIAEIPDRYDLIIEIDGEAIFTDSSIVSGNKELRIGNNILLRTKDYLLDATILELNQKGQ